MTRFVISHKYICYKNFLSNLMCYYIESWNGGVFRSLETDVKIIALIGIAIKS